MVEKAVEAILEIKGAQEAGRGRMYETRPQGRQDQPWFINTALAVRLEMAPERLLAAIKEIETRLGRTPGERWGPREIDIDIIFYGETIMETEALTIPHPMAAMRRFVLAPVADIDPELVHPLLGRTVSDLLASLPVEGQETRLCTP